MTVREKLAAAREIERGTVQRKTSFASTSPVLVPLMAHLAAKSPTMPLAEKAATQTTQKPTTTTPATPYAAGVQAGLVKTQESERRVQTAETGSPTQKVSGDLASPVKPQMAQQAAKSPTTQLARSFVTGQTSSQATIYNRGPTKELARGLELQRLGRLDISAAQRELNDMETTQRK